MTWKQEKNELTKRSRQVSLVWDSKAKGSFTNPNKKRGKKSLAKRLIGVK